MINEVKLTTDFAKQVMEELVNTKCVAPDYYRARAKKVEECMDKCIKTGQNVDGVFEFVSNASSQKTLANFCLRALYSGVIDNATIYAEEMRAIAIERLGLFTSMRGSLSSKLEKLESELEQDSVYREAIALKDSQNEHIREAVETTIERKLIPVDFARKQLDDYNGEMYNLVFGTKTPSERQTRLFEKFVDKYDLSKNLEQAKRK